MPTWATGHRSEPLFDLLDARPIETADQLELWLLAQSELNACINEESSKRYVAMTCHTDDQQIEAAFLHYVENIVPRCKPRWQSLRERFMHAARPKTTRSTTILRI